MHLRSGTTPLALAAVVAGGLATSSEGSRATAASLPTTESPTAPAPDATARATPAIDPYHRARDRRASRNTLTSPCDVSGRRKPRVTLPREIAGELRLDGANDYFIEGVTRVRDGAALVVPRCTRLEGSPAPRPGVLLVQRGGRLVALGTPEEPILFTSSRRGPGRAGQWGGIVLLGRAPIARPDGAREAKIALSGEPDAYGGDADTDDSGALRYVRIEFGGRAIAPGEPSAALTLAGVGSATAIAHVMVSHTEGDCVAWRGGNVQATQLVCNDPSDDYFAGGEGARVAGRYWFGRGRPAALGSRDRSGIAWEGTRAEANRPATLDVSHLTLCETGEDSASSEPSQALLLTNRVAGTITDLSALGFGLGIDVRGGFVTEELNLRNSAFHELVHGLDEDALEYDEDDDDHGASDGSPFREGASNRLAQEPPPFTTEDCLERGGPSTRVLDSGSGAFAHGSRWFQGAWLDWSDE